MDSTGDFVNPADGTARNPTNKATRRMRENG
jgi:hypothetical protein